MASATPAQTDTVISLKDLSRLFGYEKLTHFSKDWQRMTDQDKVDIRRGILNGSFTY